ncbi:MAG TPA: FeoA family protein [Tepidisphaeraceae bacterium]|nr:FeoA family protein [Tepidisphaeraceae bacterium]
MQKACDLAGCEHSAAVTTCELNTLGIGCSGSVVSVGGDPDVRRRLLEMGFCNGAAVEVVRRAPLGDPIEFRLRGYHLSLRHEQARFIQVSPAATPVVAVRS